jgi:hypothetical protein
MRATSLKRNSDQENGGLQEYGSRGRRACGRLAWSESQNRLPPHGRDRAKGGGLAHRGHGLGRNRWRRRRSLDRAALHPGAGRVTGSRGRRQQRITTFVTRGCRRPFGDGRHGGGQQAHSHPGHGHRSAQPPTQRSHRHGQLCPQYAIRSTSASARSARAVTAPPVPRSMSSSHRFPGVGP